MSTTLIAKIIGPVLLVRALSMLIDRSHFSAMIAGLDREVSTVAFSFFPIALMMGGIAILTLHSDLSSLAAILIRLMAIGAIGKAAGLMLFPQAMAAKAVMLEQAGFLNFVLAVCVAVGGYFTWFGYAGSTATQTRLSKWRTKTPTV